MGGFKRFMHDAFADAWKRNAELGAKIGAKLFRDKQLDDYERMYRGAEKGMEKHGAGTRAAPRARARL